MLVVPNEFALEMLLVVSEAKVPVADDVTVPEKVPAVNVLENGL